MFNSIKRHLYFSILLWLFLGGCTAQNHFSGKITLPENSEFRPVVYLLQPRRLADVAANFAATVIDSARLAPDGSFVFKNVLPPAAATLFEIAIQKKHARHANFLEVETSPRFANYLPVVWQPGEHLQLLADGEALLFSAKIFKPSPANAALSRLREVHLQSFEQHLQQAPAHPDEENLMAVAENWQQFQQPFIHFADTCQQFLSAAVALRWMAPTGDFERVPEVIFQQCQKWQDSGLQHAWLSELCSWAAPDRLPVRVGEKLPNFRMPILTGDTIGLHQLLAKRLTLIDLWASWCAPCRRENREVLVPLWNAYHEKGFEIVGYALDASRSVWQKAIEKDGANRWLHASHLAGDDAPLLAALRLTTIPANLLVDAEGRVLAKNLHGEALRAWVEAFFGQ